MRDTFSGDGDDDEDEDDWDEEAANKEDTDDGNCTEETFSCGFVPSCPKDSVPKFSEERALKAVSNVSDVVVVGAGREFIECRAKQSGSTEFCA